MRCRKVQDILLFGGEDARAAQHLNRCPNCQSFARDLEDLGRGFRALATVPLPEPSWGFVARVLRRLQELSAEQRMASNFFEVVGRRVVYAASILAIVVLMALALPSSGPLRSPVSAELVPAQPDRSSYIATAFLADERPEAQDLTGPTVYPKGAAK